MGIKQSLPPSKRSRSSDMSLDIDSYESSERAKRRCSSHQNITDLHLSSATEMDVQTIDSQRPQEQCTGRWSISRPVAGVYSNLDPVFSLDEKYLFIGLETAVRVYTISTSCLLRTLHMKSGHQLVAYRLCPMNPEHLYIFSSCGNTSNVYKWEWASGRLISQSEMKHKLLYIDLCYSEQADIKQTLACTIRKRKDGKFELALRQCLDNNEEPETTIFETSKRMNLIRVAHQGRVIVVCDGQKLLVGRSEKRDTSISKDIQYSWREMNLPTHVTSLDIRECAPSKRPVFDGLNREEGIESVDLILGESTGSIAILYDLVRTVQTSQSGHENKKDRSLRRIHWHRGPVNTLRWSKDGHYVISGGSESVMVLWQLDTGRKQFLPHLSAPICNIAISPIGDLYAVKLADNSILVLSARELRPHALISGLQLSYQGNMVDGGSTVPSQNPISVVHPRNPDQLLVVFPTLSRSPQGDQNISNTSILQTYDLRTNNHISRQALSRTNTTSLPVGPDGNAIVPPGIELMDVTHDGQWLATVDDWHPSIQGCKALRGRTNSFEDSPLEGREVFLKFWKWNSLSNSWELFTRVGGPHFLKQASVSVLGLASNPRSHEFATMGADATLRIWSPTAKRRSRLPSKPIAKESFETWKCRLTVDLSGYLGCAKSTPLVSASLCFSEDGSALAICGQIGSKSCHGLTFLVNTKEGRICHVRDGIFSGTLFSVKFLGKYLVTATDKSVSVWDMVEDFIKTVEIPGFGATESTGASSCLLAVDRKTYTFALASALPACSTSSAKRRSKAKFHFQIYGVRSLALEEHRRLRDRPLSLVSDPHSSGYIMVDAAANVTRFAASDQGSPVAFESPDRYPQADKGLSNVWVTRFQTGDNGHRLEATATDALDKSPTTTTGFKGVFGGFSSSSMPSLDAIFREMVRSVA
ncbi:hypothetical protein ASPZODRAFT_129981 [Penicilliopsis zonata CBS 506.65]|uniref:Uncharacterized protein n=1 Tax=Penicilliopsis zonata CBS 506.65 TaxID=1073090 RepID=A0A1L9SLJ6_9EURO|nr:hypothetical protein ASPZODRAFT_129981 [Penicilliopsis zonata CBS 506.65]OJJ48060.1 hypothetical protein ASPZODRAFT_129981 [Penicilliopsis zonata CBS 506.65]